MERGLVAILAADVVGYSRLMRADETGTFERLDKLLQEVIQPTVQNHTGRIVKLMGDGYLVEFQSVIDAMQCAAAIQDQMLEREPDVAQDQQILIRIGVNFGDVIRKEDDIYGDGVNIAARLEGLADPGGICLSGKVYDEVNSKLDLTFEDMGEQSVKNIPEPIRTYQVRTLDSVSTPQPPTDSAREDALHNLPAIAVLPFTNMSDDPDQEYFSDGLTEDIITALSQWRSIPVIARNSVFTYKGKAVRVQDVARELGVQYILEGSVRKAGNRLRITAQLIDAKNDHHIWAEKFDRQLEDIFDVQDEITNHIAATIVPELETFENRRSASKRTEDLNAWDHYLRGMTTFNDETCEGTASSMKEFQAAVEIDPDYSDAWARLGWCYAKEIMFDCSDDPEDSARKGFEAGRKAVDLDDASALAHVALATVHIWANETDQGLAEALHAVDLNPNFAHAMMAAGNRLDLVGRTEEGIAKMQQALALNPRDPIRWRYMAYLSRAFISLQEFETAAKWGTQAVSLRPDLPEAQFRYAICLAHLDRVDDARKALEKCSELDSEYLIHKSDWRPYPDQIRNDVIMSGLRRHDLIE